MAQKSAQISDEMCPAEPYDSPEKIKFKTIQAINILMRLVHFSDTHLGYSDYNKTDPDTGINQREADIYSVFEEIIEYILRTKPDLVIHSGDLFDSIRPSNRAIREALEQLDRLSKAKIPTVIIAGNHSTPRQRSASSIFNILRFFDHIHPIFKGRYETLEICEAKIHAIPHPYNDKMLKENFDRLEVDKKFRHNILITHAAVIGASGFRGTEFKELSIPKGVLSKEFDYIALGHFHEFAKISDNAYYSGSPERMSFNEIDHEKGFLDVTLGSLRVKHVKTRSREMLDIKSIDCSDLDATQVMKAIHDSIPPDISGKIMRLTLKDLPHHVYSSLDFREIDHITSDALYCEKRYTREDATDGVAGTGEIGSLVDEFASFMKGQEMDDDSVRKKLEVLGMKYLEDALQTVEEVD